MSIIGVRGVKRNKKIEKGIIYGAIAILGSYVILSGGSRIVGELKVKLNQGLQKQAEKLYLPNLTYASLDEQKSFSKWIVDKALQMIPIGGYVQAKEGMQADVEDDATKEMILKMQGQDENEVDKDGNLVGENKTPEPTDTAKADAETVDTSLEKLRDFDYLLSHFYTVDSTTMIDQNQLNVDTLLGTSMKIEQKTEGPKVLIFHTHSQETFADSVDGDVSTSIVGIGDYLMQQLNAKGISTIHDTSVYDIIDGKLDRSKAYEMSEAGVRKILEENPTVEVLIDLHRDGVGSGTHLVTDVNGKQTAKIMFFNGLSRTRANGDIAYLANPYIQDNLSFSLQMQLASEKMYPGFARRIYLKGYRYSLHMKPKSLLIEAGAQTNTVGEMKNAMESLSDVLHHVLAE